MKHLKLAMEEALAEVNPEVQEQPTVVMTGPLSTIYTRALNLAYAKTNEGEMEAGIESQAMDAAVSQAAAQRLEAQASSDNGASDVTEIPYNYNPSTSKDEESQEVLSALKQIGKRDIDFIFYQDETIPEAISGDVNGSLKGSRMLAVESIQVIVKLKKQIKR